MVTIFAPLTRAGELVLASELSFPAARANIIPFSAAERIALSKASEVGPPRLILATSPALP